METIGFPQLALTHVVFCFSCVESALALDEAVPLPVTEEVVETEADRTKTQLKIDNTTIKITFSHAEVSLKYMLIK